MSRFKKCQAVFFIARWRVLGSEICLLQWVQQGFSIHEVTEAQGKHSDLRPEVWLLTEASKLPCVTSGLSSDLSEPTTECSVG